MKKHVSMTRLFYISFSLEINLWRQLIVTSLKIITCCVLTLILSFPLTSAQLMLSACLRSPAAWPFASPLEAWHSHPEGKNNINKKNQEKTTPANFPTSSASLSASPGCRSPAVARGQWCSSFCAGTSGRSWWARTAGPPCSRLWMRTPKQRCAYLSESAAPGEQRGREEGMTIEIQNYPTT